MLVGCGYKDELRYRYSTNVLVANLKLLYWALCPGLEIATDMVANATKTLNLATKNTSLVATLATMFL